MWLKGSQLYEPLSVSALTVSSRFNDNFSRTRVKRNLSSSSSFQMRRVSRSSHLVASLGALDLGAGSRYFHRGASRAVSALKTHSGSHSHLCATAPVLLRATARGPYRDFPAAEPTPLLAFSCMRFFSLATMSSSPLVDPSVVLSTAFKFSTSHSEAQLPCRAPSRISFTSSRSSLSAIFSALWRERAKRRTHASRRLWSQLISSKSVSGV
mmetsp:Transcript_2340/g.5041  ORF Transcript_2340/g.5041 Transcript_2340/m.5041 type:complete len:211 (-) Transcript_2340:190-822(-)